MTEVQTFVALRAFRFGTTDLQIGDPVPVEAGRDYRLMQRLGQISPAGITVPAGPQEKELLTPYREGSTVVFVAEDGSYTLVTFAVALEASGELREEMGLEDETILAEVQFPDEEDSVYVPIGSLLPEWPTGALIDALTRAVQTAAGQPAPAQAQAIGALEGRVGFLELLLSAVRTEGQPLPDDFASVKELRSNGVGTVEGLRLLVDGEQGRAHLIALDRIGEKSADRILAALTAAPDPPAPEPIPEG